MSKTSPKKDPAKPPIVGSYLRYSDGDLQTENSLDSQLSEIGACAQENGWIFNPEFVFADPGISGETLETRSDMMKLIAIVQSGDAPFDGIVIDDTNRLGRRVSDVMRICEIFQYHGIFLYFVNPRLHSEDPKFERDMLDYARGDQDFLQKLRHAVRRGQREKARNGMNPGGFRYGYTSVLIPDPTRRGTISRPAVLGTRLVFVEEEKAAVKHIYDWANEGLSLKKIAECCTAENFPPPGNRLGGGSWNQSNVWVILHNPIYKGALIWGRTRQKKHYKTGKSIAVPVEEKDWVVVDRPDLQIVSPERWECAQQAIAAHHRFGFRTLGGMARRSGTEVPLLSGLMRCGGSCKKSVVCCGSDSHGERVLGCKKYKQENRSCTNGYTVTESALEEAVIHHIVGEVLQTGSIELAVAEFHRQLSQETESRIEDARRQRSSPENLQTQEKQIKAAIQGVLDSLDECPKSKALLAKLARLEQNLEDLQSKENRAPIEPEMPSIEEARSFFLAEIQNLSEVLQSSRPAARDALRRHIAAIYLTPELQNGLPVFRVHGKFQPHPASGKVMQSGKESSNPQHYERCYMEFEFIVPARTCKKDYLSHSSCPPEKVQILIDKGLNMREIAKELNTSFFIVQRVVRALGLRPKKRDYLNHPKCPTLTVLQLRKEGKSYRQIGADLGVSEPVVWNVVRAMEASGVVLPPLVSRPRPSRKINYLEHPKCPVTEAVSARKSGRTVEEIGAEHGVSSAVIRSILRAFEIADGTPLPPVPQRRPKVPMAPSRVNYLNHPSCPVDEAVAAWRSGMNVEQIGIKFGVSTSVVRSVFGAFKEATGDELERVSNRSRVDYLNHPQCPVSEVSRLEAKGFDAEAIGKELGASPSIVGRVLAAMRDPSRRFRDELRVERPFRRSFPRRKAA